MGFFDNVLKTVNKVKKIADDIQDVSSKASNNSGTAAKTASASSQSSSSAGKPAMGSCTLSKPEGIASRLCRNDFYDTDSNGNDVQLTMNIQIDKRFHECDSAAMEVDCCFVYSPDITDENECGKFEPGTPYIMIGFEQFQHNVLDAYNKGKALPDSGTISKVASNSLISYKTTINRGNEILTAYHFKRGFDEKLLYHMEACYPASFAGKPMEKVLLDALDLMASTYSETKAE